MTDVKVAAAVAKLNYLVAKCDRSVAQVGERAEIALIKPGKGGGNRDRRRLWGVGGGPVGRVVGDHGDGHVIVMFRATEVKRACLAKLAELTIVPALTAEASCG